AGSWCGLSGGGESSRPFLPGARTLPGGGRCRTCSVLLRTRGRGGFGGRPRGAVACGARNAGGLGLLACGLGGHARGLASRLLLLALLLGPSQGGALLTLDATLLAIDRALRILPVLGERLIGSTLLRIGLEPGEGLTIPIEVVDRRNRAVQVEDRSEERRVGKERRCRGYRSSEETQ